MLATRKLTVGDGYQYLSRQVAAGDVQIAHGQALTNYYAATGTAPGRWYGSGLAGQAGDMKPGDEVTIEAMTLVFRDGRDPTTGEPLGVPFDEQRTGRGKAVAGFDLVFTVPKSASVLWALGDEPTRRAVVEAHRVTLAQALDFLEDKVARTRIGAGGCRQVRTGGLIAAGFAHVDSRLNDPNLHTHLVVANKVQSHDGTWRSIDGRTILAATVAVSELYDGLLADELSRRLGVTWRLRDRGERPSPALAIDGLPDELLKHFSGRTAQDPVHATTADGTVVPMRALSGPQAGYGFEIVWVATEQEWNRAQASGDEADGLPWPFRRDPRACGRLIAGSACTRSGDQRTQPRAGRVVLRRVGGGSGGQDSFDRAHRPPTRLVGRELQPELQPRVAKSPEAPMTKDPRPAQPQVTGPSDAEHGGFEPRGCYPDTLSKWPEGDVGGRRRLRCRSAS